MVSHKMELTLTFRIEDNVHSIFYAEEQVGFLAGYAAVKEGFTKLGFMGGMAVPAVVRFGYGFVQGAEYAAAELDVDC
jgi:basic membrane protein A and related proteins